jgi:hypothetical protein
MLAITDELMIGAKINKYRQVRPQHEYIYENNKLLIDHVGRFENLANEWKFLCEKLKINDKLFHIRGYTINEHLKNKHYRDYYDDETKAYVSETYKKDLELFGYEF